MQAKWQQWSLWFETRSRREQLLLAGVVVVVLYQLMTMYLLDYQFARLDQSVAQLNKAQLANQQINLQIQQIASQTKEDPNIALQKRISRTKNAIGVAKGKVDSVTRNLVSPRDMARLLERLLFDQNLQLKRLLTNGSVPLIKSNHQSKVKTQLYRHDFEIEFTGDYLTTLAYIEALEQLPFKFYWQSMSYIVDEYPVGVIRVELYTLSLSKDWIGV